MIEKTEFELHQSGQNEGLDMGTIVRQNVHLDAQRHPHR
jgi:hypothetical protein